MIRNDQTACQRPLPCPSRWVVVSGLVSALLSGISPGVMILKEEEKAN